MVISVIIIKDKLWQFKGVQNTKNMFYWYFFLNELDPNFERGSKRPIILRFDCLLSIILQDLVKLGLEPQTHRKCFQHGAQFSALRPA